MAISKDRPCPTCGSFDVTFHPDYHVDGWMSVMCTDCDRLFELGRPGVGPLIDPEWKERQQ